MENDYLFEGLTISAAILVASAFIYRYHLMGGFFSTKKVDVGGGMKKDGKYVVSGTSVDKKTGIQQVSFKNHNSKLMFSNPMVSQASDLS